MKTLLFCFFTVFILGAICAQTGGPVTRGSGLFLRNYFTTPFEVKSKYAGIEGSPFIDEEWMLARIYTDSLNYFDSVKIRINAFENTIHFLDEASTEYQATSLFYKIIFFDKASRLYGSEYRSGYYNEPHVYYQVLDNGPKACLLLRLKVDKFITKAMFEESKTVFQPAKEFVISMNNRISRYLKDCASVDEIAAPDKDISQFIKNNALKCNKEADLRRIVHYINSK